MMPRAGGGFVTSASFPTACMPEFGFTLDSDAILLSDAMLPKVRLQRDPSLRLKCGATLR
ncbi:MAG TPA: hypothetical protein VKV39_14210 [Candidatus Sulfotelmatobacter sp.]|nr:hypothetical protein [Candidatus Sulfotelmatobacter sp.]